MHEENKDLETLRHVLSMLLTAQNSLSKVSFSDKDTKAISKDILNASNRVQTVIRKLA